PPEKGVVDRPLDIAISQFAPGSETVKDRLIHTALGVVHYMPGGTSIVEQPNPLGPPRPIGVCRNCQAVDDAAAPGTNCPVCNAGAPASTLSNLASPKASAPGMAQVGISTACLNGLRAPRARRPEPRSVR